jgi:hypothetical protein
MPDSLGRPTLVWIVTAGSPAGHADDRGYPPVVVLAVVVGAVVVVVLAVVVGAAVVVVGRVVVVRGGSVVVDRGTVLTVTVDELGVVGEVDFFEA